jgi:hypothetical protein
MPTGQLIAIKCPRCMRGKFNRPPRAFGVERVKAAQREAWRHTNRGRVMRTLTKMRCLDCDHWWWSTLVVKDRRLA